MPRIAILDLGTNTFNLLIAEKGVKGEPSFIYSKELPVEIGKGGIHKGIITPEATKRAIHALLEHRKTMREYEVEDFFAFATSAVRGAENRKEFIERLRIETGVEPKIVSGEEEAQWIYEGVKHAKVLDEKIALVIDIGGGSTEIVIANKGEVYWKKSYKLGVTRLYELFAPADPLIDKEAEVKAYILNILEELIVVAKELRPSLLIGTSGSYDSFANMLVSARASSDKHHKGLKQTPGNGYVFPMKEFNNLHKHLIKSTLEERQKMPGLIPMRVPMIAFASLLTAVVLKELSISEMKLSRYAMKEGIAGHLLNKS
jgi:exopolyphosphatase/guanosine-5'-triphosphate,3'-diphosphate pyrophosphatase